MSSLPIAAAAQHLGSSAAKTSSSAARTSSPAITAATGRAAVAADEQCGEDVELAEAAADSAASMSSSPRGGACPPAHPPPRRTPAPRRSSTDLVASERRTARVVWMRKARRSSVDDGLGRTTLEQPAQAFPTAADRVSLASGLRGSAATTSRSDHHRRGRGVRNRVRSTTLPSRASSASRRERRIDEVDRRTRHGSRGAIAPS